MNAEVISTSKELTLAERAQVALQSQENEKKLRELAAASKSITVITNKAGYDQCHSSRMALKRMRLDIEATGKGAREDAQKFSTAVIAEQKRLIGLISPEEQRLQELQDTWDAEQERIKQEKAEIERKRVAAIQERIEQIRDQVGQAVGEPSSAIKARIQALVEMRIEPAEFAECVKQAEGARETTLIRLRSAEAKQILVEEEQERLRAERERLAREREEQERLQAAERARIVEEERQARLKRDAEEKAAREAREAEEARARAAREAEEARLAALRAEQEAALQAERERLAEQERLAAEARKVEEDRLAAERQRQQEEAERLAAEREQNEINEANRRRLIEEAERQVADERGALEEARKQMREAGSGAPAGATTSESGDSNMANTLTEPPVTTGAESSVEATSGPETTSSQGFIDIVFDGPPSAIAGRFVEVENAQSKSISIGEWVERADKLWALRVNSAELGITPAAWMRGVSSPGGPWGPPEHDVECYAGDEPPDQQPGWIPLYRKVG